MEVGTRLRILDAFKLRIEKAERFQRAPCAKITCQQERDTLRAQLADVVARFSDDLITLRAENAEMKARLSIEWDGVANERDALRKENNELRARLAENVRYARAILAEIEGGTP